MSEPKPPSTSGYAEQADALFVRYEAYDPAELLAWLAPYLPEPPADVLDVGAGTGRDAAWLARCGHRVVAAEPVHALREGARALHPEAGITWVDDRLPGLTRLRNQGLRFDAILLSAVWMHLDPAQRRRGMATLSGLARVGACLGITLRHGPVPEGRRMFAVTGEETLALAREHGFRHVVTAGPSATDRDHQDLAVTWTKHGFVRLPNPGP